MTPRPDEPTLLRAVARFLEEGVRPSVTDRGLAFRLRIAAHLLATTAVHLEQGEGREDQALATLSEVLGTSPDPALGRRDALEALEGELVARLAEGTVDRDASLVWIRAALRSQLAITSPRFALDADVETPPSG